MGGKVCHDECEVASAHGCPSRFRAGSDRWLRLAAACIIMLVIGFIYGWPIFSVPLMQEFSWSPSVVSFTFTVLMWSFCAGGFLGARLLKATSSPFVVRCSALLMFVSFFLTALFVHEDAPLLLYLTYGLLGGCGVGMSYTVVMGTTLLWFPDRTGLVSGILLLCYSMSTFVLGSFATWLFSLVVWRVAFVIFGLSISLVMVVLSGIMRAPFRDEGVEVASRSLQTGHQGQAHTSDDCTPQKNIPSRQMIQSRLFWVYALWMLVICSIGLGVTGSSNHIMRETGANVQSALVLVGVFSVCNGCGRLAMGVVFDALGLVKTMVVASFLNVAGCGFLVAALMLGNMMCAAVGAVLAGIGIGGSSVIGSGFAYTAFGERYYAQNLSVLNLVLIPAAFVGPVVTSMSVEQTGSYGVALEAFMLFGLFAATCAWVVGRLLAQRAAR